MTLSPDTLQILLGLNSLLFVLILIILFMVVQILRKGQSRITPVVFHTLLFLLIVAGFFFYRSVFSYVFVSMIFVYLLNPFVSWFERKHIPRWISIIFVYLIFGGVIAYFTSRYIPELINQGNSLLELMQEDDGVITTQIMQIPFIRSVFDFLESIDRQIPMFDLSTTFQNGIEQAKDFVGNLPMRIINNYEVIISTVSFVATIPLISFFLLKDGAELKKQIMRIIPNRYYELFLIILNKLDETVGMYFKAMFFEVIVVSILASFILSLLGVRNAILIGVTAGVANIIPYFGPFMGVVVALFSILIYGGPVSMMINVIIAMYAVQVLDNNIIYPVVIGKTINMHPLIVLLTVLAGGWFGGILWMLISVPLVYLIYSVISVLYINLKRFELI